MPYAYGPLGEDPAAFSYWQACGCCRVGSSLSPAHNRSFPGSRTLPSDDHRPIKGTSQVAFVALGRLELAQKHVILSQGTFRLSAVYNPRFKPFPVPPTTTTGGGK